ncbi:MAG: DUF58 domain-containing protein [Candidatus Bathyarchaeia archaeon]
MAWFGAAAITVGLFSLNPFAVLAAAISFAYLGVRAVQFKRFISALSDRIEVRIVPLHLSTLVNAKFRLEAELTNSYRLPVRIIRFHLKVPPQVEAATEQSGVQLLGSQSELHIGVALKASSPGQFNIMKVTLTLDDASKLFKHDLILPCTAALEVAPLVSTIEPKLQLGSIALASLLGTGTDLARIREVVSQDDFHSIDWKSTARTGKFMKKEYYAETDPAVVIVVDKSVLTRGGEFEGNVLVQLGKLTITFGSSTPVGAIIHDDRNVIEQVMPSASIQGRQLILRSFLAATTGSEGVGVKGNVTRLYQELVDMIRLLQLSSRNPPRGRVDVYARSILPYYERNATNYPVDLAKQGIFRALELASTLSPALVIVISGFHRDLSGLCEGLLLANASGHRIVLAIVGSVRDAPPSEVLSLRESGIQVLQSGGADLVASIRQAIIDIPTMRIRHMQQIHLRSV